MSVARVTWKKKTSGSFYYAAKKESLIANICNNKSGIAYIDKKCEWCINNIIKMQRRHCCVRRTKIS